MTSDQLAKSCRVLFGKQWKTPLAYHIGVRRETVSRWANNRQPIPVWASRFITNITQSMGAVLSLCDRTGNMVKPWAEAGFECFCIDIQHKGERREGNITYIGADILHWLPPPRSYTIVFAFPPCTNLAVSGARWFRDKGIGGLSQAIDLVEACRRICEWSETRWMIENPVSTLSSYWRVPDYTFDPCDYGGYLNPIGDQYSKKTCLWAGGGFIMPKKKCVESVEGSRMHRLPPSANRGDVRSITPKGFAQAVFLANTASQLPT